MNELTSKVIAHLEQNDGLHTYKELATALETQPRALITVKRAIVKQGRVDLARRVVKQDEKYAKNQVWVQS